jgi:hypothetical protein
MMSRERLLDRLVDAYVDWREACGRVNDAYRSWSSESSPRNKAAFGAYLAALDAEQQAAEVYAGFVSGAEKLPWSEDPPTERLHRPPWGIGWR